MNIDYYKIIASDYKELVSDEEYANLKKIGQNERALFLSTGRRFKLRDYVVLKANEIVKRSKYENMSNIEKAILVSNIAYEDDKFSHVLVAGNFNYDLLNSYLKIIGYLKIKTLSHKLTKEDEIYQHKVDIISKKLYAHFVKYLGATDINVIINKINEIMSFSPELLMNKVNTRSK